MRRVPVLLVLLVAIAPAGATEHVVELEAMVTMSDGPSPLTRFGRALWPNAHEFPAGHRIALTVSATDFPTFKPEPVSFVLEITGGLSSIELPVL